jgi:hypothetical protein
VYHRISTLVQLQYAGKGVLRMPAVRAQRPSILPCTIGRMPHCLPKHFFVVGYKGGEIYWLAMHSNQANLIVGGLRHRRHQ